MEFLNRIRPNNLLIIALTQCFFYFIILQNAFEGKEVLYSYLVFVLTCILTLIIASTGYIINDLIDSEIDRINHPDKEPIDKHKWSRIYAITVLVGMALNVVICYLVSMWMYIWIYPLAVFLLFLYSSHFKCKGLIGNLIVALFSAFVVGILLLPLLGHFDDLTDSNYSFLMNSFMYYFLLGFMISLVREIVKDIEDVEGDKVNQCQTVAVSLGVGRAKIYAIFFLVIFLMTLAMWIGGVVDFYRLWQILYVGGFVGIPIVFTIVLLVRARTKEHFHSVSSLLKTIMILGILFLFITQLSF